MTLHHLEGLELQARKQVEQTVFTSPQWPTTINQLVVSYLAHHGYHETAQILARDTQASLPTSQESTQARKAIKDMVLAGQVDQAIGKVRESNPSFFEDNAMLLFRLTCRKFIEIIAQRHEASGKGAADDDRLEELLVLGQEVQQLFDALIEPAAEDQVLLQDAFSLLAYTNLTECPVVDLLRPAHRAPLANDLNSAMLMAIGQPAQPPLQRLVDHTQDCIKEMLVQGHGEAAFIKMEHFT
jgi:hypothetical protein